MAKTKGVKSCTPGNVKCGGRCIPQSWDCRLRGEGQDKQLKASRGLDPLATAAQIERGIKRIGKGIEKASFSELEGGRRQIIRTVSRNSRGEKGRELTLKEKKEIQDRLISGTAIAGTALLAVAAGYRAHRILSRSSSYRRRVGNSVNEAFDNAQTAVTDNIPFVGTRRARTTAAARASGDNLRQLTRPRAGNRAGQFGTAMQPPTGPDSELQKALKKVSIDPRRPASEIEAESLRVYLGHHVKSSDKTRLINVHAEATAMQSLAKAYGMEIPTTGSISTNRKLTIDTIAQRLKGEQAALLSDLKQLGRYNVGEPEDYIEFRFGGDDWRSHHARELLKSSGTASTRTRATEIYEQQAKEWSKFYDEMANAVGDDINRLGRGRGLSPEQNDLMQIARLKHATYLDRSMEVQPGGRINSLGTPGSQTNSMKLTAVEYHARKNRNVNAEWTAPKGLVSQAAREQNIATENWSDTLNEMSKKFVGLRDGVTMPVGVSPKAASLLKNKSLTEQEAILNIYKRLVRERKSGRGNASRSSGNRSPINSAELMRQAEAEYKSNKKRRDSERNDFTAPGDRTGQPCGKSFIPKSQKCSKPTTARYAEKPQPTKKGGGGSTQKKEGDNTLGKVLGGTALAAGAAVAGGVAAFKNRRKIGLYAGNSKSIAQGMNQAIVRLNQKDVKDGIAKLPKQWQQGASQLLGKAKAAAAYVAADVQGFEMKNIDNKNNFSTWATPDKSRVMNIGSVDDTLMVFNAKQTGKAALRTENGKSVPIYDMDFTADLGFQQKEGVSRESGMATVKMVKAMNQATIPELGNNALLKNVPYAKDGKGDRRASLYKRAGYRELQGQRGSAQWAMLNNGKVEKIPEGYDAFFDALIRGKSYDEAAKAMQRGDSIPFERFDFTPKTERKGKPCGESFIGKTEKCTKSGGAYAQRVQTTAAKKEPADPTPYIAAIAVLASATSIVVNRKAIQRHLREIGEATGEMTGKRVATPKNVISTDKFVKRNKATVGFDAKHPSNKVWTTDLKNPDARKMDGTFSQLHDMGLMSAQRKYKANQALDVGTDEIVTALQRTKTPEAEKFAAAVKRLGISTDGDVVGRMNKMHDTNNMDIFEKTQLTQFKTAVQGDDAIPFGGLATDSKAKVNKASMVNDEAHYKLFRGHERPTKALNYDPTQLQAAIKVSRAASKKSQSGQELAPAEMLAAGNATGPARGANADMGIIVHESMHIIDFNGGDLRRSTNMLDGKTDKMKAEAAKYGFSLYGGSDWGTTYNEFVAEASVYYTFDGADLKKNAPTIYAMIDELVTKAARPKS